MSRRRSIAPRARSSSCSCARSRTCGKAWASMADELIDRLDGAIDAVVARRDATAALRDPELAPLVRIAADLRHYPGADFKARLRAQLERRKTMATAVLTTNVREGFTTVTPYVWVADRGLADFLMRAF